jgi:hypothetical protein
MTDRKPLQLRLPTDLKAWLEAEAEKNGASQNSEVIRAIRAAQLRTEAKALLFHADMLEAEGLAQLHPNT